MWRVPRADRAGERRCTHAHRSYSTRRSQRTASGVSSALGIYVAGKVSPREVRSTDDGRQGGRGRWGAARVRALTAAVDSLSARLGGILGEDSKDAKPAQPEKKIDWADDTPSDDEGAPGGDAAAAPKSEKSTGAEPEAEPRAAESNLAESSYDVQVTLADQQADPNSPLYSAKSFDQLGLHEDLLKGIYSMKFTKPSKIQERALPLLLHNPPHNMIGQSQSGTGKTAAFVLTMLSRIDYSVARPQAVALARTSRLRGCTDTQRRASSLGRSWTSYRQWASSPR